MNFNINFYIAFNRKFWLTLKDSEPLVQVTWTIAHKCLRAHER